MNYDDSSNAFTIERDAFLPVVLIGLSLLFFFIWQVTGLSSQRTTYKTVIERQDEMVKQSRQVEAKLQAMAQDLLTASKTDDLARQIVAKYNIQQGPPNPGRL